MLTLLLYFIIWKLIYSHTIRSKINVGMDLSSAVVCIYMYIGNMQQGSEGGVQGVGGVAGG